MALVVFLVFVPVFHPIESRAETSDALLPTGIPSPTDSLALPIDTLVLEELRILAPRIERPDHQQPVQIQTIDKELFRGFRQESAAYLIANQSFATIRDYGAGNMATISQRGFPPGQTRIMWEELPLNHPMLGLLDLSLIPAGLLDGISTSAGNPAAMTGSGGIGGTIALRTTKMEERAFISQHMGSFGSRQTGAGASIDRNGFQGSVRAYHQYADYDFSYDDPVRGVERTREHNAKSGSFLVGQGQYRRNNWQFRSLLWLDDISNDLPGPISALSPARQEDRSIRWVGQAGYDGLDRVHLSATAGWYQYALDYTDKRTNRTDASTTRLFLIQPAMRYSWNESHDSRVIGQWAFQKVSSDNYADPVTQQELSTRIRHTWEPAGFLSLYPSVEAAYHTMFDIALNPALGVTVQPVGEELTLRGMISRNRNNPSYNDLYWMPGGNPDLVPETVYSYEGGITWRREEEQYNLGAGATLFLHDFEEGIRWRPGSDGYFTPENIEDIRSRGLELEIRGGVVLGSIRTHAHFMTSRTRIQIRQPRFPGDDSVGKQMIYVPEWTHNGGVRVSWRDTVWLHISRQYTGERYTTFDHTAIRDPLNAFTRTDLDIGAEWPFSMFRMDVVTGIRNLGDRQYEMIQWYPAAPRHFHVTATFSFI